VTTKVNFKPPEQLIMRKRKADRNLVRAKRVSKDSGRYSYEQKAIQRHDAQVALVIRIRGFGVPSPEFYSHCTEQVVLHQTLTEY
jgi:hypothetical protein